MQSPRRPNCLRGLIACHGKGLRPSLENSCRSPARYRQFVPWKRPAYWSAACPAQVAPYSNALSPWNARSGCRPTGYRGLLPLGENSRAFASAATTPGESRQSGKWPRATLRLPRRLTGSVAKPRRAGRCSAPREPGQVPVRTCCKGSRAGQRCPFPAPRCRPSAGTLGKGARGPPPGTGNPLDPIRLHPVQKSAPRPMTLSPVSDPSCRRAIAVVNLRSRSCRMAALPDDVHGKAANCRFGETV